jgi:hypothetical protein
MKRLEKVSAIFAIVSSFGIVLFWSIGFIFGFTDIESVVEQDSGILLLASECFLACMLFLGGIGLLRKRVWGLAVFYIAMGMLLYALFIAIGQLMKSGFIILALYFVCIAIADAAILAMHLFGKK